MSPVEDTRDKLKVLIPPSSFLDYQSENCSKFFVECCENFVNTNQFESWLCCICISQVFKSTWYTNY